MSSADAQLAFQKQSNRMQPTEVQEKFSQQFDLSRPEVAMSSYQKLLHDHTRQQYEMASSSSRRRSADSDVPSLASELSVDSTTS
ncbi:hypothetical protein LTR78_000034 [Recurvomyces mirabilis]|uniref:Uncharacterized protein n=1 Tax=Recurvomyces mirabilis TaxID=574656 RepID=A0AAE0WXA7_9PEZI|nr:hypothetical protein LTR78_000034 [Recurvomyces mirabilis]KAK5161691.1 hypothetical protein LTS14_000035 [Recurvomyces mirabilis]